MESRRVDVNANEKKDWFYVWIFEKFQFFLIHEQRSIELELSVWPWALLYFEESNQFGKWQNNNNNKRLFTPKEQIYYLKTEAGIAVSEMGSRL